MVDCKTVHAKQATATIKDFLKLEMDTSKKSLFSTPHLGHATSADFESVYEPAEDSFLMLDALEQEYEILMSLR